MGRVYELVREVVQGTLNQTTLDTTLFSRPTVNEDSLSDAIEELDKIFLEGISRLKVAVSDNHAVALSKTKHAKQVIEDLKANITRLEARVRETEDTLHHQNVVAQTTEESLRIEIGNLQRALNEKEEALQSRIYEVNDLRSKIDVKAEEVSHLDLAIERARRDTASKVQEAEQVIEGLKVNITGLETRLKETVDTVTGKDAAIQNLESNLTAEIRDLQSVVKDKDQALESRETEVKNLRSRIDVMAEQISQSELAAHQARRDSASKVQEAEQVIESLKANIIVLDATRKAQHRQVEQIVGSTDPSIDLNGQFQNETEAGEAEALANQAQAITKVVAGEQLKTIEEKSTTIPAAGVAPNVVDAGRETVSPEAFVRIIASFSEFANVIETIASLILRDHVRAFGESLETFPQKRFPDLLDSLSNEISDNKLQADFRERVGVTLG